MLILGEEVLFHIDNLENEAEIYLKYLGRDQKGIKMSGRIPNLWLKNGVSIRNLALHQGNYIYRIIDFDLNKNRFWLKQVGFDLNHMMTEKFDISNFHGVFN
jgi:hypothetical protein